MINLFQETKRTTSIGEIGTKEDDWAILFDVSYDNGYGRTEVAKDLLIVGKNWWLEWRRMVGVQAISANAACLAL